MRTLKTLKIGNIHHFINLLIKDSILKIGVVLKISNIFKIFYLNNLMGKNAYPTSKDIEEKLVKRLEEEYGILAYIIQPKETTEFIWFV